MGVRVLTGVERHFFRNEREHSAFHGDRLCVRTAGVPAANSGLGTIQCRAYLDI